MINIVFRIVIALLISALIWWVGPLIAIGKFFPIGAVLTRKALITIALLWGFWPVLVRLWLWMARRFRKASQPVKKSVDQTIYRRVKDIDAMAKRRWLDMPRNKWKRVIGLMTRKYRSEHQWYLLLGNCLEDKVDLHEVLTKRGGTAHQAVNFMPLDAGLNANSAAGMSYLYTREATWFNVDTNVAAITNYDHALLTVWSQLLSSTGKLRGKIGFNSVLVSFDVDDFVHRSLEQRRLLIDGYRQRLVEMREILGCAPYIYVTITGLEHLVGGQTLLQCLDENELVRGVGIQCQLTDVQSVEQLDEAIQHYWANLEKNIQQRILLGLEDIDDTNDRYALLRLAEGLAEMKSVVAMMVAALCFEETYTPVAILRSIWLGCADSQVDSNVSDINPSERHPTLLWSNAISHMVSEGALVTGSNLLSRKHQRYRRIQIGVISTILLSCLVWFFYGYIKQIERIDEVWAGFESGTHLADMQDYETGTSRLLNISAQMQYALSQTSPHYGWLSPFFAVHQVNQAVTETYKRHLQKTLYPEFYNQVQLILTEQVNTKTGDIYQTLKVYLMLAKADKRNGDDVSMWIRDNWTVLSQGQYSEEDRLMLITHVNQLLRYADTRQTPIDTNLVRSARALASDIPSTTRVLERLMSKELPSSISPVSLVVAAGYDSAVSLRLRSGLSPTDEVISPWYTREAYQEHLKPSLQEAARVVLTEESWVLRDAELQGNSFEIEKSIEQLADAARSQFLQDYISQWQKFLKDITVRPTTGLDDAAVLAGGFADPASALVRLIRFVGKATTLVGSYDGDMDSWMDRQKLKMEQSRRAVLGELTGEHLRNKQLPEYQVENNFEMIRNLARQLGQADTRANNPVNRLFESVASQLSLVNGAMQVGQILPNYDAFVRLRNEASRQPEPIRGIVLDLLNSGSNTAFQVSGALLNRTANSAIQSTCQGMSAMYPFRRSSTTDVAVGDFQNQFSNQGVMATQFKEQLAPYVDTTSTPWRARAIGDANKALVNNSVIHRYEVAQQIGKAFLDGSGNLMISSLIRVVDMDSQLAEVRIEFGQNNSLFYAHGASVPKRIDWRGDGVTINLNIRTIDGKSETITYTGPWAIFRLYDAGKPVSQAMDRRETAVKTRFGTVRVEWQALNSSAPLWSGLLSRFRC